MRLRVHWAIILALPAVFGSGCATVFHSSSEEVVLFSSPPGATVAVDGATLGPSPQKLKLQPKKPYLVTFSKEGYESKSIALSSHIPAGWIVLDVFMGLVPVVVDAITGSWSYFDETRFLATLQANAGAETRSTTESGEVSITGNDPSCESITIAKGDTEAACNAAFLITFGEKDGYSRLFFTGAIGLSGRSDGSFKGNMRAFKKGNTFFVKNLTNEVFEVQILESANKKVTIGLRKV